MNKENSNAAMGVPTVRITRARAKALGTSGIPFPKPPLMPKRAAGANSKRAALDENKPFSTAATAYPQNKRRAVFADMSNVLGKNGTMEGSRVAIIQKCLGGKPAKKPVTRKNSKVVPIVTEDSENDEDVKLKIVKDASKTEVVPTTDSVADHCEVTSPPKVKENSKFTFSSGAGNRVIGSGPVPRKFKSTGQLEFLFNKAGRCDPKPDASIATKVINIDSKHKDPLMCTTYSADIHNHINVTELSQRPSSDYMEKLQRDITQSMRSILIDWLVEVSEEYKLVPDTLYLTVNLIDRYLSQVYIEKQRLQLLGVTCMLIASKYEEITVPRVEEFCFITDNTYTREEVVKMECEVLNLLRFQLSFPTAKTFLRRFLLAAQATSENPSVDVEYLANYLAELTMLECSFLKYLPSLIAASAVFLARWTLDPSVHPWNPTLEYYTSYKPQQLNDTVVALQDLQSNKKGCTLNAIREKYRQGKFIYVANLTSKPVETLFTC